MQRWERAVTQRLTRQIVMWKEVGGAARMMGMHEMVQILRAQRVSKGGGERGWG